MKTHALDLGSTVAGWMGSLAGSLFQVGIHSDDYFIEISLGEGPDWFEAEEEEEAALVLSGCASE